MHEPSALDRQWVEKLNRRAQTPAKTTAPKEGRSTINVVTYDQCQFYIIGQPQARTSTGSTILTILIWITVIAEFLSLFSH